MSLTIVADTSILARSLNGIRADMPWVTQNAINNLLKGAQQKQYERMRTNFTIRNQSFLKNSIRLQFANKQTKSGRIFVGDLGGKKTGDIWKTFEGGGTKTPSRSKNVAVPTDNAWPNKGRVKPLRNKPRNLPRSFVIKIGGTDVILNRTGRGTRRTNGRDANLKLMYILTKAVQIPDKLNFYQTVIPYINTNYDAMFMDSFMYSIRKNGFKG